MTQEGQIVPPPVMWAQRKDALYVTICLEDCTQPVLKVEPEMIYFKGVGGTDKKMHEVTINLYKEVDPTKTVQNVRARVIELILIKKEEGPYWPRLTKETTKAHWLKSDFNKWKDEEDTDDEDLPEGGRTDLEKMMRQMGRLGDSDDSQPNMDSLDSEEEGTDSDDEFMPSLE